MTDWAALTDSIAVSNATSDPDYGAANVAIVRKVVEGLSIDSGRRSPEAGVRVVYNVSSVHVRAVLVHGFRNCYDLATAVRVGEPAPAAVSVRRCTIDDAIGNLADPPIHREDLYYGAVELNGSGMRYYGDACLVLQSGSMNTADLALYRNSYDLDRNPIRARVAGNQAQLEIEAGKLAGSWRDVGNMVVCKTFDGALPKQRLMTTGSVSEQILHDEDYLEIPRRGGFGMSDIAEVRLSAADVAAEGRIADQAERGPTPTLAEHLWRHRRRDAERALADSGVPVRVVVSSGRVRA